MVSREIVHTCSNAHIAWAALISIGGDFERDVAAAARMREMPAGVLVANFVRDFSRRAAVEEWEAADEAAIGADQPILSGLRYIVQSGLRAELRAVAEGGTTARAARRQEAREVDERQAAATWS